MSTPESIFTTLPRTNRRSSLYTRESDVTGPPNLTLILNTINMPDYAPAAATTADERDRFVSTKQFKAAEDLRMAERQAFQLPNRKAVQLKELKAFSNNFRLNVPVPKDLLPMMARDEEKRRQILEKSERDAKSARKSTAKEDEEKTDSGKEE